MTTLFGVACNYLLKSETYSKLTVRRIFNTVGCIGPAMGLIWVSFVDCDRSMAIAALCVSVGLQGGVLTGFQVF